MICEHCKHVFVPPPQPPMVIIRRVCPRCWHIIDDKFPGMSPWHDIRRYKATCDACQKVRDATDGYMVAVDPASASASVYAMDAIHGINWWLK